MIITYRDIVSRVRSSFKLISSDDSCTDRFILGEILATNKEQCIRQLERRIGWSSPSLFTTLPCISMDKVPLYSCCDTSSTCDISRSVNLIPQIVDCNYNLVVQGVWSIDRKFRFKEIGNPDRYANQLIMYPHSKERFFWIQDNYLYTTDPLIEKVSLNAFFREPIDPTQFTCDSKVKCPQNPLDLEFKSLPKVEDAVVKLVSEKLLKTYKQSSQDLEENDRPEGK